MSNPRLTKNAKRRWKTLRKLLETFKAQHGRDITSKELSAALNGGR